MIRLLEKTRTAVASKLLAAELKRKRIRHETVTFEEAKNIGLLFSAVDLEDLSTILEFREELIGAGKKVNAIGMIRIKDFEKKHAADYPDLQFISSKNLNFLLKPKGPATTRFARQDFDMLISLNHLNVVSLNYVAGISKAKLRIGPYYPNTLLSYDFMIRPGTPKDLRSLITEIRHYLKMIKK